LSTGANIIHKNIGEIFRKAIPAGSDLTLLLDSACGGNQHIPLFCTPKKARATEFCNVDLLVLKNNKIKIIVEIEESHINPTQICGKLLTSALSNYYIHESKENQPIEMADSVLFIQIVDTSKLIKDKTAKQKQWKNLEDSMNKILPVKDSKIKQYRLFTTDELDNLKLCLREMLPSAFKAEENVGSEPVMVQIPAAPPHSQRPLFI